jgi:AraC-like DNA-binding protein
MRTNELNTLIVILNFGSLILLSFITFFNPLKVNRKANYWFGAFLILWSTFWLDEILNYTGIYNIVQHYSVPVYFIQFFTPIVFYISIVYFTNPNFKFHKADLKYIILPAIYLIILILQQSSDEEGQKLYGVFSLGLILIQVILYTVLAYFEIRKHQKKILSFVSETNEIDLSWLEYIILSIFLLSIVITLYNIFFSTSTLNAFINLFLLMIIFIVAYNSIKQKEIFPLDENQRKVIIQINEEEHSGELRRKIIPDSDVAIIKSKLNELMEQQKPFLDSELNLIKLSKLINITPHHLSYVINAGFSENFFRFINTYRVEKAKELLVNADMNKLSMLGIAFESGFNSKTSFNTTFKKITGMTPSDFKKRSSDL